MGTFKTKSHALLNHDPHGDHHRRRALETLREYVHGIYLDVLTAAISAWPLFRPHCDGILHNFQIPVSLLHNVRQQFFEENVHDNRSMYMLGNSGGFDDSFRIQGGVADQIGNIGHAQTWQVSTCLGYDIVHSSSEFLDEAHRWEHLSHDRKHTLPGEHFLRRNDQNEQFATQRLSGTERTWFSFDCGEGRQVLEIDDTVHSDLLQTPLANRGKNG